MINQTTINILDVSTKIVLGLVGVLVSWLLYLHNRQQREEEWLKHFSDLHESFWKESDFADVRSWIACQKSYEEVRPILALRRQIDENQAKPDSLEIDQYKALEKLDKFCNLMMRVIALNPAFDSHKFLWKRLFFDYWVVHIADKTTRPELHWYIQRFYSELLNEDLSA